MIKLLARWLTTSNPSKKFRAELDLMFWGAKHSRLVRRYFQRRIFYVYNCDISHSAEIHSSVKFPHPCGVVIGSKAKVAAGCHIYQQVTIGSDNSMAYIKKNTFIGSGAKLIGGIEIGENCHIGANAVVTKNFADDSTIVGNNHSITPRKPKTEK
ncbi:MAG: serine acetyltransferase [Aliivibrio sp.]|uniref:serine acetyltransferase n=1 Tax=Aliivibrio sp. TaxID=1872443 RepID=UPI001A5F465D|nr:serine acetyltransferase [Aliivibrio sp.]